MPALVSRSPRTRASAIGTAVVVLLSLALAVPAAQLPAVGATAAHADNRYGWTPSGGVVYDLAVSNRVVYVAGQFRRISNSSRGKVRKALNVAAFRRVGGKPLKTFRLATDGPVFTVALSADGQRLYLGGSFSRVNGKARANIAAVHARSGRLIRGWHPAAGGPVRDLLLRGSRLFVGGQFITFGGERRLGLAVADTASGKVRPFDVETAGGRPLSLTLVPGRSILAIGGTFKSVDGRPRQYIALVNSRSGRLLPWQPAESCRSCKVAALVANGRLLYAGQVGAGGGHVEALAVADGRRRFSVKCNGDVRSLALDGHGSLFVGGHFTPWFGGQRRTQVAAISAQDGRVLPFAPSLAKPHPGVFALVALERRLFVGGGFASPDGGGGRFAVIAH